VLLGLGFDSDENETGYLMKYATSSDEMTTTGRRDENIDF